MTYIPRNWAAGDIITEQALDHIEQGIAELIMYVHTTMVDNVPTMDKTFREIANALADGTFVVVLGGEGLNRTFDIVYTTRDDDSYIVLFTSDPAGQVMFTASSADDYPSLNLVG